MNILDAVFYAAIAAYVVAFAFLHRRNTRRIECALQQSFQDMSLISEGLPLTGADLVVVKKAGHFSYSSYDSLLMPDGAMTTDSDAFWYCSGPGARWFLAIPSVRAYQGRVDVQLVVRPLTEQRARAVLRFDREAYRRAFGAEPDEV
ncbi:hypothetical protein [Xanthomonas tesorieronis]|uniref:hypothetical protein n=1 Tax=Xanthomonas tesorieronis TaxID=3160839 RepID=UPI00351733D3